MRVRPTLAAVIALLAVAYPSTPGHSITTGSLRKHVEYLASDALRGRGTGEPGVRKAEEYIARSFRKAGLSPMPGQDGYFLDLIFYRAGYDESGTTLSLQVDDRKRDARAGEDFRPFPFSDEGSVEAAVVFAGYGITSEEHGHDDYQGLDVDGKLVLVLRHEPGETDPESSFGGTDSTNHALFTTKASNARAHGAVGMLLVTDPLNHEPGDDLRLGGGLRLEPPQSEDAAAAEEGGDESDEEADGEGPFLAVQISQDLAGSMVESGGRRLDDLQRAMDDGRGLDGFRMQDVTVRLAVQRSRDGEEVAARDVAGFLEGSDPVLKDQWVVVGAHHDHLGGYDTRGDGVFNGADDNASGTSGVLELARAFGSLPEAPRRSMLFLTFTGEERGLLGSRAVVSREMIPMDRIVFMFNLDMIGRNSDDDISVFGDGYVQGLRPLIEAANSEPLPLEFEGAGYTGNSDHAAFHDADVPFMFFFTGIHEDYHQLGDHADKLDYDRMESIVSLAFRVLQGLASADEAPGFIHHVTWLGVQLEVEPGEDGRLARITVVDEGSPAEQAGLQAGDVVRGFDDETLADAGDVGGLFRGVEPGAEVSLEVVRGGDTLRVALARARTGYMGVFPGPLDDDQRRRHGIGADEGILLRAVIEDGPSDKAGLQEGDIVLAIGGRPVGNTNLRAILTQIGANETVDVLLIRGDERMTVPVTLGERPRRG